MTQVAAFMLLSVPAWALTCHLIGDFFFQSNWMALEKKKCGTALWTHCFVYSVVMALGYLGNVGTHNAWAFFLFTYGLHILTDALTSQMTSALWFVQQFSVDKAAVDGADCFYGQYNPRLRHWFFVAIGVDQLLHYLALAWTLQLVR